MEEDAEFSDPQIEAILLFEGNNKCNDCDEQNPKWTSINNAVFLCAKCARKHKKYPQTVSLIKSLEVDEFDKGEILLLRHGGNTRFKTLMTEYNIPLTKNNNEYKYKTKLADYYRKALREETREGRSLLPKPDKRTAIQMIDDNDSVVTNVFIDYTKWKYNIGFWYSFSIFFMQIIAICILHYANKEKFIQISIDFKFNHLL